MCASVDVTNLLSNPQTLKKIVKRWEKVTANLCVFRVISSVDLNHGCALVSHASLVFGLFKKGAGFLFVAPL